MMFAMTKVCKFARGHLSKHLMARCFDSVPKADWADIGLGKRRSSSNRTMCVPVVQYMRHSWSCNVPGLRLGVKVDGYGFLSGTRIESPM